MIVRFSAEPYALFVDLKIKFSGCIALAVEFVFGVAKFMIDFSVFFGTFVFLRLFSLVASKAPYNTYMNK